MCIYTYMSEYTLLSEVLTHPGWTHLHRSSILWGLKSDAAEIGVRNDTVKS